MTRVPAQEIEEVVRLQSSKEQAQSIKISSGHPEPAEIIGQSWTDCIERIDVFADALTITLTLDASFPEIPQDVIQHPNNHYHAVDKATDASPAGTDRTR